MVQDDAFLQSSYDYDRDRDRDQIARDRDRDRDQVARDRDVTVTKKRGHAGPYSYVFYSVQEKPKILQ